VDAAEIRTAAEVERLTPDERQRLLNDRVITSSPTCRHSFLARARPRGKALLEARQALGPDNP
jgi:hypothetical protein